MRSFSSFYNRAIRARLETSIVRCANLSLPLLVSRRMVSGSPTDHSFRKEAADARKNAETDTKPSSSPLLYRVPVFTSHLVGRQAELLLLWQRLLQGQHIQMITGMDGIGKSSLAAEFCDRARRSGRFSCIQWCQGRYACATQLQKLFEEMRGRAELDVLLVIDDVEDTLSVLRLLPRHPQLYVVLTAADARDLTPSGLKATKVEDVALLPLNTLREEEMKEFLPPTGQYSAEEAKEILCVLNFCERVPLLVQLAVPLISERVINATELLKVLKNSDARTKDGENELLSVSKTAKVLLEWSMKALQARCGTAPVRHYCQLLACLHLGDLSDTIIEAVLGSESSTTAATFSAAASTFGFLSIKWETSAYSMHHIISTVLRSGVGREELNTAADVVSKLWPRRWREMASQQAYPLVWHSYTLLQHFKHFQVPLTNPLLHALDRSALFLAHYAKQDLPLAAEMWHAVMQSLVTKNEAVDREAVRIGRECGRLLHFLRDERAQSVLETSYNWSVSVHGERSVQSSILLSFLAPYLLASPETLRRLNVGLTALEETLKPHAASSADDESGVISVEERRMLLETLYVLLLRKGQVLKESNESVPESLRDRLEEIGAQLSNR